MLIQQRDLTDGLGLIQAQILGDQHILTYLTEVKVVLKLQIHTSVLIPKFFLKVPKWAQIVSFFTNLPAAAFVDVNASECALPRLSRTANLTHVIPRCAFTEPGPNVKFNFSIIYLLKTEHSIGAERFYKAKQIKLHDIFLDFSQRILAKIQQYQSYILQ